MSSNNNPVHDDGAKVNKRSDNVTNAADNMPILTLSERLDNINDDDAKTPANHEIEIRREESMYNTEDDDAKTPTMPEIITNDNVNDKIDIRREESMCSTEDNDAKTPIRKQESMSSTAEMQAFLHVSSSSEDESEEPEYGQQSQSSELSKQREQQQPQFSQTSESSSQQQPQSSQTSESSPSQQQPQSSQASESLSQQQPQSSQTSESSSQQQHDEQLTESEADIVIRDLPNEHVAEAEEVQISDNDKRLVDHDEYAINVIRGATVHFRLRRTQPQLWRHGTVCYASLRVFAGMDDGVRLVAPGVQWHFENHHVTTLLIASIGYVTETSKSAKIVDNTATQVIVRDIEFASTDDLKFEHMYKVSAMKLFRHGTPLAVVNTTFAKETKKLVDDFVQKVEDQQNDNAWAQVKPLIPPLIVRVPNRRNNNKTFKKKKTPKKREDRHARYRQKQRELKKKERLMELQKQRAEEKEKKRIANKKQADEARRRRATIKLVQERMNAVTTDLQSLLESKIIRLEGECVIECVRHCE